MPRPLITATRRLLPAGAAVRACEPTARLGLLIAAWAFTPAAH